ncbi:ATP-dependent protease ATPase subunit HslU [Lapidilactobacillus gannanensis]|uniref:ATP-dependent protease ATPase subunit HslU n=1 Tax=Lapidilactobacillus gannanensis TaxID=2486002 RepID=A0ABW4BRK1_9LACO|nr:ATP-dependent protease ATPase subunit HslU [Lapidilactobacillus gannanensis]
MTLEKTPRQIVAALDDYVIGQNSAKRAVAVALYNRYRRHQLNEQLQKDITPKNLLMIGPTGVGKTEIARRLAMIVDAPFVKVEATKFTEVGYVGRDVEAMVRDLADAAVAIEERIAFDQVRGQALREANKELIRLLAPGEKKQTKPANNGNWMQMMNQLMQAQPNQTDEPETEQVSEAVQNQRMDLAEKLNRGLLENREVTIKVPESKKVNPMMDAMGGMGVDMSEMLGQLMPSRKVKRTLPVKEAREILIRQHSEKLIDRENLQERAIKRAQDDGIIFIDEIDKLSSKRQNSSGEVSREGVQRDILPIVEGSQVNTKYGPLDTSHMLFIGSGAFAQTKPSDLIPELQGRFPIRVELDDLSKADFIQILTEPHTALIKQYIALVGADGVKLTFTQEAIEKIAEVADDVNKRTDNIGARRLATILEKVLEEVLFDGPDMQMGEIMITEKYVADRIDAIASNQDLTKYIL